MMANWDNPWDSNDDWNFESEEPTVVVNDVSKLKVLPLIILAMLGGFFGGVAEKFLEEVFKK